MNVSKSKISRYERGISLPDMPFLLHLSNITKKPIGDIIKFNGRSRLESPFNISLLAEFFGEDANDLENSPQIRRFLEFNKNLYTDDKELIHNDLYESQRRVFDEFRVK